MKDTNPLRPVPLPLRDPVASARVGPGVISVRGHMILTYLGKKRKRNKK
jgi:hypothetical protein